MTRQLIRLLICVAVCVLTGCRNNYEQPPPAPPPPTITNHNLQIALQMSPRPVRQMDPTTLTVRLANGQGRPVIGASVRVDLVMPAMDMGRNTVTLMPGKAGMYAGTGRFPMDGDWRVTVTATKEHDKAVQTYPVAVR